MSTFLRIVELFWKYRLRVIAAYACLFAGAGMSFIIPRFTGLAIDQALNSREMKTLMLTALAVLGAGLLRSALSFWQIYQGEHLSQRVAYDLRNIIYDRLQRLSYTFHDRSQTGQLMSRATADVEAVRTFVGFALLRGVYYVVLLIAIAVVLFIINWKLALLCVSVLPFLSARTVMISRKLRDLWMQIQEGIGVLGSILQENLSGVRLVRAFAREDFENRKFRNQAEIIYRQEIKANNLIAANNPVMSFALLLAMAGILWYGGRQVVAGALTHGELAQFLLYVVMLQIPLRVLGWMTVLFTRAMSSGVRIFEIIDSTSPLHHPRCRPDCGDGQWKDCGRGAS